MRPAGVEEAALSDKAVLSACSDGTAFRATGLEFQELYTEGARGKHTSSRMRSDHCADAESAFPKGNLFGGD